MENHFILRFFFFYFGLEFYLLFLRNAFRKLCMRQVVDIKCRLYFED